jgi:ketosteroid isomerase-like protein
MPGPIAARVGSGILRAMSQENVELVRGLLPSPDTDLVALFREEATATALAEAVAPLFHEDFEAVVQDWAPGQGVRYAGLQGLRAAWLDWLDPWESYRTEVENLIDAGDDVVALVRDHGRRAGMAVEVGLVGASVWTVRDGKIAKAIFYPNRSEALEAVGLSDQGGPREP